MSKISIKGDINTHGGGILGSSGHNVYIDGEEIVTVGTISSPDSLCPVIGGAHCSPNAASGSSFVFIDGIPVHLDGDSRTCGASTIASGQDFVNVEE